MMGNKEISMLRVYFMMRTVEKCGNKTPLAGPKTQDKGVKGCPVHQFVVYFLQFSFQNDEFSSFENEVIVSLTNSD